MNTGDILRANYERSFGAWKNGLDQHIRGDISRAQLEVLNEQSTHDGNAAYAWEADNNPSEGDHSAPVMHMPSNPWDGSYDDQGNWWAN